MKKMILLIGAALALASCAPKNDGAIGSADTEAGIYGGDEVKAADTIAATTVGIYNSKEKYLCTGSLYGQNLVITAAHCLEGNAKDIEIRFGVDMHHPSVTRKVVAGKRNNHFTGQIKPNMGDVSMLKYEGTIPAGFHAAPLLSNYHGLEKGAQIVAAGYGISRPTLGFGSGILRKVTLKVGNPAYTSTEVSVDQGVGSGVCNGDSGGPAFLQGNDGKLYLWGVTSNGAGLPIVRPCMFFSVFTRIDVYQSWITQTAGSL